MRTYRNTLNVFRHKLEEFEETFQPFAFDQNTLSAKLKQVEDNLLALWKEEPAQKRQPEKPSRLSAMAAAGKPAQGSNLKNVHEGLPKPSSQLNEGPTAFRNLFPEEESEERLPEMSPQFKAF